ncbi:MAG: DNA lyase [Gammaproteobacteria bacterium]|nr:DNA lyase [Gammaproteobacteria bacterium]
MRLWSIHPKYLDAQGIVALWRETLLAQAVLRNETKGYRNHPQLERFKNCSAPLSAISAYLKYVHIESECRGYSFDESKIKPETKPVTIKVTSGQMSYEWKHLMSKLEQRSPAAYEKWHKCKTVEPHPLFEIQSGEVESWERH